VAEEAGGGAYAYFSAGQIQGKGNLGLFGGAGDLGFLRESWGKHDHPFGVWKRALASLKQHTKKYKGFCCILPGEKGIGEGIPPKKNKKEKKRKQKEKEEKEEKEEKKRKKKKKKR
jgi:hypothetical protein